MLDISEMRKPFVLFSILTFMMLWTCIRNHKMNWDGIAYAALTIYSNEMDERAIHQKTFEMLRKNVPDGPYQNLTQTGKRSDWSSNAEQFIELLPIHKAKYLYVLILRALWMLGIGPFQAMTMISLISTAGICLLVFFWLIDKWKHWTVGLVSFLICYTSGVYEVSRYWTPDATAALTALSSIYILIEKKSTFWAFFC